DGLLLDPPGELAGDVEVDVGLEQRHAHLAQRRLDVGLGQAAAAAQAIEHGLESVTQALEHDVGTRFLAASTFERANDQGSGWRRKGSRSAPGRVEEQPRRAASAPPRRW